MSKQQGRIVRSLSGFYDVRTQEGIVTCRGRGIAKALYEYTCHWAKGLGCAFVTLNVWCGNDSAMAFYNSRGMKPRKIYMETTL